MTVLPRAPAETTAQDAFRFLSVGLCDRRFALPLDRVIGVVESDKVTPIPFSPPPFEGLVQAMGQIVPQISLAALLGLPAREGGILVVVSDAGGSLALRVEQVFAMLQIDREKFAEGSFSDGPLTHTVIGMDLLTGGALVETSSEAGAVLLAPDIAAPVREGDFAKPGAEPYLIIGVSNQTYAVKLPDVLELIELSSLRPVPHGPDWIAGMIELRGEPILGISLARLLDQQEEGAGRLGMVFARPQGRVALIASRSLGIEHFTEDQIHPLPEPIGGIASYLVRQGESIAGVIAPDGLLRPVDAVLPEWIPLAAIAAAATAEVEPMRYRQLLTVRAGAETIAIPLDRIHRLQASVQFTPIPDLGTGFDGMADIGDGVVPVIDLRRGEAAPGAPLPPCVLARIEGSVAGLIVDQVLRIETVPEDQFMPALDAPGLPMSDVMHLQGRLMSVLSLDRLLPPI